MSKIFELFGYPISDTSLEAQDNRRKALCPFMGKECDGGGNRPQSAVSVSKNDELGKFFGERSSVHSGICSLSLSNDSRPWIVCPRRLLSLNCNPHRQSLYQQELHSALLKTLNYKSSTLLGIWPEVGLKYMRSKDNTAILVEVEPDAEVDEDEEGMNSTGKSFDYRFDYIIMPIGKINLVDAANSMGISFEEALKFFSKSKEYSLSVEGRGGYFVNDFPYGQPYIIEIMTCSTSGGNKKKRTTIPMAFEDAILGKLHNAPGINYRQVWARMASQLIVKSEVAIGWGGKTIWVVQDTLIDYISRSTALDIHDFVSEQLSEVNMLSFSYDTNCKEQKGVIDLTSTKLFSGPIAPGGLGAVASEQSFLDILRTPDRPPLNRLVNALTQKRFANTMQVP